MYLLACWAEALFAANSPARSRTTDNISVADPEKKSFLPVVRGREVRIIDCLGKNERNNLPLGD